MLLEIEKYNEVYMRIFADSSITEELHEYFTFRVEGYRFMPAYKSGRWDGNIRLYNKITGNIYLGLLESVKIFANKSGYEIKYLNDVEETNDHTEEVIDDYITSLDIYSNDNKITIRDYQLNSLVYAINNNRAIIESPTGSGKSLLLYILVRWYIELGIKCLIIVPTIQLVEQLSKDFIDYSSNNQWNTQENIGIIYSGKEKTNDKNCVISTYQSLIRLPKNWFTAFGMCITDEAHTADNKSISTVMNNLVNAKYRFGTTGTLKESKTSLLSLQGMFGAIYKPVTTRELMDNNTLAKLSIKAMLLNYTPEVCKDVKTICKVNNTYSYQKEIDWLISNDERNNFIANLSVYTSGNTLVLFQFVEKHGKILHKLVTELLISKNSDRKVFYIHGGIDIKEREIMRNTLVTDKNVIVIASYQTLSTGINAPSIENIILASPTKSKIRLLQSIGRSLRLKENKSAATIYDIGDNLKCRGFVNHTLTHFVERLKLYATEDFDYKLINVNIK